MMASLDVLVVDDRPETVRFLTEFLVQRCRSVDVASSVREAQTAIHRRRSTGERYHLVISDLVMPDADGLSLLRDLRNNQDDVSFIFATGYRGMNPNFEPEAKRLGAMAILDKPINLRQVETLLEQTTAMFRKKQAERSGDQPFFGTSRVYRKVSEIAPPSPAAAPQGGGLREVSGPEPVLPPLPMPDPGAALERRTPAAPLPVRAAPPVAPPRTPVPPPVVPPKSPPPTARTPMPTAPPVGYQRRPSAIISMGSTTSRIRRSVDAPVPPQQPGQPGTNRFARPQPPQPGTSFTARIRRGMTGAEPTVSTGGNTESGRMFACTMCGRQFMVMSKPVPYTTVCVHCGQLQRIDPA